MNSIGKKGEQVMGFKEKFLKIIENDLELVMRTVVQLAFVVGLVVSAIILAVNMKPTALIKLSKSCDECMAKTIVMTNRLHVVSDHLQAYSKQMDEMDKRFAEMESRLHVTTNLMQECSMRMDKMTNGLDKKESMLSKIEQKPCVLKIERWCNCWCPCCIWKVGCQ